MKKFLGIILAVMMLATVAFAADITVTLNGEAIDFADQAPEIVDGRTLVPLRAIFEALGASVEWDQATKTVTSSMDDVTIKLTIGENTLYRNGEAKTLDVAAQILNGRTMVPARAIAEAYGVGVEWDAATRTVVLTQEVKAAEEKLDENTFFVLTGENYTGAEGYQFTSGVTIQPEIVADFEDADNKVLFLHSTYTEKQSWSYFRDYAHVKFAPGERYLVKFRVSPEFDSADNNVPLPSFGICFRYADTAEDGSYKDHGVYTATGEFGKWTEVYFIFTIPETLDASKGSGFGIFANPSNNLPVSFYLDDVSVSIYDGPASDGVQSPESMKAAEAKKDFNIDEAKGITFDYDDSFDLSQASASEKFIEDGNLVMVAAENFPDPQVYYRDVSYSAAEYDAIAVRFKAENANTNDNAKAKTFQIYYTTDSDDKLSESKSSSASFDECIKDGDWYVAYIVMTGNENWKGNITLLRLDPANDAGTFTIDKFVLIEA